MTQAHKSVESFIYQFQQLQLTSTSLLGCGLKYQNTYACINIVPVAKRKYLFNVLRHRENKYKKRLTGRQDVSFQVGGPTVSPW